MRSPITKGVVLQRLIAQHIEHRQASCHRDIVAAKGGEIFHTVVEGIGNRPES
jgi:hypothetical protein